MHARKVKVAIVGTGTAGMNAYRAARAHTDSVVVIEGGPYGTTCARVGCMPSKLLIAAAEAAHGAREAGVFGVRVPQVDVDGRAVMSRVQRERDRFVGFVLESVERFPEGDRVRGFARFVAPGVLQVGDDLKVEADAVVLATGSEPHVPDDLRVSPRVVTSDDVFEWEDLPDSVLVVGSGVIALELGQALARLGVRVRALWREGRIGLLTDPRVRAAAAAAFTAELGMLPRRCVLGLRGDDGGIDLELDDGGRRRRERFDWLLVATGRVPRLSGLGLEHSGVELDGDGRPRFDAATMLCRGSHPVFLAGDANDDRPLLHEAADEGRIAGDNAARAPDVRPGHRRFGCAVMFTDPQVMVVGPGHAALCKRHGEEGFVVGEVDFADQGRSRMMAKNLGLLRVYAGRNDGTFLGAEMLGPRAEHLAHLLSWAGQQRLGVADMLAMPFYHPVVEEGLRTALRDASRRVEASA